MGRGGVWVVLERYVSRTVFWQGLAEYSSGNLALRLDYTTDLSCGLKFKHTVGYEICTVGLKFCTGTVPTITVCTVLLYYWYVLYCTVLYLYSTTI